MSKPAEVFPLCHYLVEELRERGETAADVSRRCNLSTERVTAILGGARVTLHEMEPLALALGVSATFLAALQMAWIKWGGAS